MWPTLAHYYSQTRLFATLDLGALNSPKMALRIPIETTCLRGTVDLQQHASPPIVHYMASLGMLLQNYCACKACCLYRADRARFGPQSLGWHRALFVSNTEPKFAR